MSEPKTPELREQLARLIDESTTHDARLDIGPLADAILAAGWRPGAELLSRDDRRGLAAVFGYELGEEEARRRLVEEGWRPPLGTEPWRVEARIRDQRATSLGYCEHVVEVMPDGEEETCSELRERGTLSCAKHQAAQPSATAEHDTEADAWYIRVLDERVHHTTEHAPANLDWTRDGRLIGVELLGPLRRDRVDQQDLMRHAYLHVEAQKRIKSMALRVSAGAPIGWRDWIREAVWALADGGYLTEPTESTVDRARAEREAKHDG